MIERTWQPIAQGPVTWTWEREEGEYVLKVYVSVIAGKRHHGWQILTRAGELRRSGSSPDPYQAREDAIMAHALGRLG